MSDITSDPSRCDKCGTAKRAAACSVRMCAKCCVANGTGRCAYDYHRRHKLRQAPQTSTVVSPSSTSPPIPDPPAPSSESTAVVSATSTSQATSLHATFSSSHPGASTTTFAAPLTSLWTPNQAIGALLAHKQDEARRLQATEASMDALNAVANRHKSVLFHVWNQVCVLIFLLSLLLTVF